MRRSDFDVVVFLRLTSQRGGSHKLPAPYLDRHGLLKDAVGVVACLRHGGQRVAVEDRDFLAVARCHSRPAQIATFVTAPIRIVFVRTHLIDLAFLECDRKLFAGGLAVEGFHAGRDVDSGLTVFCGDDEECTGVFAKIGFRLVVGLDDVVVAQSFHGQYVGGIEGIAGRVDAVDRDGGRGVYKDAFVDRTAVLRELSVGLLLGNVDKLDVVGGHGEVDGPIGVVGIGDGACAVLFRTDQQLVDKVGIAVGAVVFKSIAHKRHPEIGAFGSDVLCFQPLYG